MAKALVNSAGKVLLRNGKVATTDSATCCCESSDCINKAIRITFSGVNICNDCFDRGRKISDTGDINGIFLLTTRTGPPEFVDPFFYCNWADPGGSITIDLYNNLDCSDEEPFDSITKQGSIIVENRTFERLEPPFGFPGCGEWSIVYLSEDNDIWFLAFVTNAQILAGDPISNQIACDGLSSADCGSGYHVGSGGTVTVEFVDFP